MYEHKVMVADSLISSDQLDSFSTEGWELLQIIPYIKGSTNLKPEEIAHYFKRAKVSS